MKNGNNKPRTIFQFIRKLSKKNKILLDEYVQSDYKSGVRTGKGKWRNFLTEYNSPDGIEIVKEILKFKKLSKKG